MLTMWETDRDRTKAWHAMGRPGDTWLVALDERCSIDKYPYITELGGYAYSPDWAHPMTSKCLQLAAEQAAGCELRYEKTAEDRYRNIGGPPMTAPDLSTLWMRVFDACPGKQIG